jgi:hypothetical protein
MRERTLKQSLAALFIVSHIGIIAAILALYSVSGFTFEEMTTCIGLVLPTFSGFTTVIVRNILREKHATTGRRQISGLFAFAAFLLPIALVGGMGTLIFLKAHNRLFRSFEEFKIALGIVEAAFSVYVAQFVSSLFDAEVPPQNVGDAGDAPAAVETRR